MRSNSFFKKAISVCSLLLFMSTFSFSQFRVVGYMPSWSGSASEIQYSKLTHINYAFIRPTTTGGLTAVDNPAKLQDIVSRAHAANVKVSIAIGGWSDLNNTDFQTMAGNSTYRNNFVNNVIAFINQYNLDGVDMDWEYPYQGNDPANFSTLMTQLGNALHSRGKILTAAVAALGQFADGVQPAVFNAVDWLNLMAYDGDGGAGHSPYSYAVSSMDYWRGRGLPASKTVLGVPFYARPSWKSYRQLLTEGASPNADFYNGDYYNGIPTVQRKTNLSFDRGAAGIMFWELSQDAIGANSLVSAIHQVVLQRTGNTPPTVSITSPSNGASFTAPANITINANASDANGTVTKVDFYRGTTLLGTDLTAPYSFTWSNAAAGSYSLTAKATDNGGAATTSAAVNITVGAAPTCPAAIASADDGNVAANVLDNNFATRWSASGDGQWIQFCLSASSSVSGVDIAFYNGNLRSSRFDVLVGPDGTNWTTAAAGRTSSGTSTAFESFTFPAVTGKYVRIVGHGNSVNLWNSYTEVRIKTGNTPPTVSITSPANGASFTAPATITINANAADADGTVSKVDFYNGSTLLGTDATSPYSFTWSGVAAGSYILTAKATDNAGAVTTSSAVNITVNATAPCPWTVMASAHDGNVPENTLDNNFATRWSASGDGQWIQYCLSSTSSVTGVQIAFYNGNLRQSIFDVQVSSDATTWTNAATGLRSSGTSTALQTFTFPARTGKYVRILGHGNTSNLWNSYTEVRINSTPTAAAMHSFTEEILEKGTQKLQAYPNPFNNNNTVNFTIEKEGKTRVLVYDNLGRTVAVVVDDYLKAGTHARKLNATDLPNGIYIIQLTNNGKTTTQKITKQ